MSKNKTAIITGAGRGIGRIIAIGFAKKGYDIILVSRTKKELEKTAEKIKLLGSNTTIFSLDVSNWPKVKKTFVKLPRKKLAVLVNAAAIQGPIGKFQKNRYKAWEDTININLIGTVNMIRIVLPKMIKQKKGVIINFSGGGAFGPRDNFSSYATSKAAVARFTETLAKELKSCNIRVNAVSPGGINTAMYKKMLRAGEKRVGTEEWQKLMKQKETGGEDPQKIVELCLWLTSKKSSPLTGKTISAVYDSWRKWTKNQITKLSKSDWLTMRRLDPYTIKSLEKIKL